MTADPRLLAGLIPVPVTGIVAKCTMNTANPIGSGANTYIFSSSKISKKKKKWVRFQEKKKDKKREAYRICMYMCRDVVEESYRDMGISGTSFGISGREDSVDKNKSSNNLCGQTNSGVVTRLKFICSAAVFLKVTFLDCLHQSNTTYCSKTLCYHIHQCSY